MAIPRQQVSERRTAGNGLGTSERADANSDVDLLIDMAAARSDTQTFSQLGVVAME